MLVETLINDIEILNIKGFLVSLLIIGFFPFIISNFAKSDKFRLFFIILSIFFFMTTIDTSTTILHDQDIYIIIALIIPHIKYLFSLIDSSYTTLKYYVMNFYYLIITICYKTINFFRAIRRIYLKIKSFFGGAGSSKQKENTQEQRTEQKQEDFYNRYSNFYDDEEPKQNKSYYENKQQQQKKKTYKQQEDKTDSNDDIPNELKQFFSTNYYTILGLSTNDDFTTIKKQYRKLIHLYHPDKHLDNKDLYTQITVNLNKAYWYFKKN
jgi:hypothetical protein